MPLIEELPVTTTQRTTQGWAYVPDIKQPVQPLEARKRGRNQGASKGEISAKQQKAIQTKLNELDKENYKDTTIAIPAKSKERAGKKITPNVRRILMYQRTFAHYLADEEAQLGNANTVPALPQTPLLARSASSRASKSKPTPMPPPPPRPGSARRPSVATPTQAPTMNRERSSSRSVTSIPSTPQPTISGRSITPQVEPLPQLPPAPPTTPQNSNTPSKDPAPDPDPDSKNPLLRSHPHLNLKPPSQHLLQTLLSEPPLSYSASRAQPLEDFSPNNNNNNTNTTGRSMRLTSKPPRHFCSICGYWGKVKCNRCGERTCGLLECWRGHEGVCAVPAY
ncbi:hypothetical protein EPUS_01753 [Endocarpon pusillum Z07020]|uniref:HIT-type domain-containing protein n=1 Tax=Endocarpon pusillum (strain Z07020 / HMAS-L-300199) TaxID=1263415 RepID=U1GI92_ENDPU|nr:uncharacterized protein EPUS_01753 [Endocarpon pusillum Z07020]ERF71838.1 hypothetical protein EPUS_01753 [Endocarpon pusillum Z07020]